MGYDKSHEGFDGIGSRRTHILLARSHILSYSTVWDLDDISNMENQFRMGNRRTGLIRGGCCSTMTSINRWNDVFARVIS